MRLFIGTSFDKAFLEELIHIQGQLKESNVNGNYVPVDNLHMTFAFIGEYSHTDTVLDALEDITKPSSLMNTAAGAVMNVELNGVEH